MRPSEPLLLMIALFVCGTFIGVVALIGQTMAEVERLVKNTFLGE